MEKKGSRQNEFYKNKIHNNLEFYEKEKKRVANYIKNRNENDEEYREKRNEYCRIKMREYYQRKKAAQQLHQVI
jgi:hypothetical protein